MENTMFKNGKWKFKTTGTIYYAQLRKGVVWLWKGAGITSNNYCGTHDLTTFVSQFEKVQPC